MSAESEKQYDVVIIGAGMGGLACGAILSRAGLRVIVLERNRQLGGNLQVFSRDKRVFDTGVHYIGGVDKGQILHQLFTYFGIMDDLKLKRMDEAGFDHIRFGKDEKVFKYAIGYDRFQENLKQEFPDESYAIETYCAAIQHVVSHLPLAQLLDDNLEMTSQIDFTLNAKTYIESLTENEMLRKVLVGNNALYAATEKTPFYVHALVLHYYIESSYRAVNGFGQVATHMGRKIRQWGGELRTKAEVKSAEYNADGSVQAVVLTDGIRVYGKHFIANAHPLNVIDLFGEAHFPKAYVDRLRSLPNSGGMFVLHLALKDGVLPYMNYNIFQINNKNVWNLQCTPEQWPNFFMISSMPTKKDPEFVTSLSVICGMDWEWVKAWEASYNNEMHAQSRGEAYEAFKEKMAQRVLDALEEHIPGIREMILSYSASTPLTQRDYTLSPFGSGYGFSKESDQPFRSMIHTKTAIPNLYLTGQNITLHGILGVSLTAILTCGNIIDKQHLLQEIRSVYN